MASAEECQAHAPFPGQPLAGRPADVMVQNPEFPRTQSLSFLFTFQVMSFSFTALATT